MIDKDILHFNWTESLTLNYEDFTNFVKKLYK